MNLWLRLLRILLAASRAPRADPLETRHLAFRVMPWNLDLNLHMTNSRYLALMDIGRLDLILRSRLWASVRRHRWAPVVGGCVIRFRRPLAPFRRVALTTELRGRDERWFYIEHRLTLAEGLACRAVMRTAFLKDGAIVAPEEVARQGGFAGRIGAVPESWRDGWTGFRDAAA